MTLIPCITVRGLDLCICFMLLNHAAHKETLAYPCSYCLVEVQNCKPGKSMLEERVFRAESLEMQPSITLYSIILYDMILYYICRAWWH